MGYPSCDLIEVVVKQQNSAESRSEPSGSGCGLLWIIGGFSVSIILMFCWVYYPADSKETGVPTESIAEVNSVPESTGEVKLNPATTMPAETQPVPGPEKVPSKVSPSPDTRVTVSDVPKDELVEVCFVLRGECMRVAFRKEEVYSDPPTYNVLGDRRYDLDRAGEGFYSCGYAGRMGARVPDEVSPYVLDPQTARSVCMAHLKNQKSEAES